MPGAQAISCTLLRNISFSNLEDISIWMNPAQFCSHVALRAIHCWSARIRTNSSRVAESHLATLMQKFKRIIFFVFSCVWSSLCCPMFDLIYPSSYSPRTAKSDVRVRLSGRSSGQRFWGFRIVRLPSNLDNCWSLGVQAISFLDL